MKRGLRVYQDFRIFTFFFIISVIILFLNDRIWKYEYSNWLTGKLSDFFGLFTLPIFLALLFPCWKKGWTLLVALCFIVWKTPLVDPFIKDVNSLLGINLARTVDYTDYVALVILPVTYFLLKNVDLADFKKSIYSTFHPLIVNAVVLFCTVVFSSTSVTPPSYPEGDILIDDHISVQNTEQEILEILRGSNLSVIIDSTWYCSHGVPPTTPYYQIEQLEVLHNAQIDTCYNVNFTIYEGEKETRVLLINLSVSENWDLQNWKTLKDRTKIYREVVKAKMTSMFDKIE